jgi:hypothetical protein
MNYSEAHQNFSDRIQNHEAITSPQYCLGPNYKTVLNFWWFMDNLTEDQRNEVNRRYSALDYAARDAAGYAAYDAARDATEYPGEAGDAARDVAWYANRDATWELIGMHNLFERGEPLTFVPMFDFTGNYELHNLDVNDIETRIQRINDFIGPKVEVENDATMTEEDLKSFIEDVELFD